jgi:hypothetical protein
MSKETQLARLKADRQAALDGLDRAQTEWGDACAGKDAEAIRRTGEAMAAARRELFAASGRVTTARLYPANVPFYDQIGGTMSKSNSVPVRGEFTNG